MVSREGREEKDAGCRRGRGLVADMIRHLEWNNVTYSEGMIEEWVQRYCRWVETREGLALRRT
jgi:hypothetical protein